MHAVPVTRALTPFLIAILAFTTSCDFERTESEIVQEAGESLEDCVEAIEQIKDSDTAKAARARLGEAVEDLDALLKEVREGEFDPAKLKVAYDERLAPKLGELSRRGAEALRNLAGTVLADPELLTTGIALAITDLWDRAEAAVRELGGK